MSLRKMLLSSKMFGGGSGGSGGGDTPSGGEDWIGDGKTHVWVSLPEGRTSPMVGLGVNGTVTVDWGDGSTPDTVTGEDINTVVYSPKHEYEKPGDYIITISGGDYGIVGNSSYYCRLLVNSATNSDYENTPYQRMIKKVEVGSGVHIGDHAFNGCYCLRKAYLADGVTSVGYRAFFYCQALENIFLPNSLNSMGESAFNGCGSLVSVTIPEGTTSIIDRGYQGCTSLTTLYLPEGLTSFGKYAFSQCTALTSVTVPPSVMSIGQDAFGSCLSMKVYDFSRHTGIPTLENSNAISGTGYQILVPAALLTEWKAATNWSSKWSFMVGV